jgi:hypothetical protein
MTTNAALPFTIFDAEVPAESRGGRKSEPNPYTDVVSGLHAALVADGTVKALGFHVPADGKSEKEVRAEIGRIVRQLRQVGANAENPYTVRTKSEDSSAKVSGKTVPATKVTFWIHSTERDGKTVPALIEKRKGATDSGDAPASE